MPRIARRVALPLAALAILVLLGLAGWLARWPSAVFTAAQTHEAARVPPRRQTAPSGSSSGPTADTPAAQTPTAPLATGTAASNTPSAQPSATAPLTGPAATVVAYYAAINAKNYQAAWNLGGRNTGTPSYAEFASGFAATAKDTFTIISVHGNVVTGRLSALQSNGTTQVYEGTYTVLGNVIAEFNISQIS